MGNQNTTCLRLEWFLLFPDALSSFFTNETVNLYVLLLCQFNLAPCMPLTWPRKLATLWLLAFQVPVSELKSKAIVMRTHASVMLFSSSYQHHFCVRLPSFNLFFSRHLTLKWLILEILGAKQQLVYFHLFSSSRRHKSQLLNHTTNNQIFSLQGKYIPLGKICRLKFLRIFTTCYCYSCSRCQSMPCNSVVWSDIVECMAAETQKHLL